VLASTLCSLMSSSLSLCLCLCLSLSLSDDTTVPPFHYNSLCYFDYETESHKALNYRAADVPYLLYNVPDINKVVDNWQSLDHMKKFFDSTDSHVEISAYHNHFLYFHGKDTHHLFHNRSGTGPWIPPTTTEEMTFSQWYDTLTTELQKPFSQRKYYYFRSDQTSLSDPLYNELPFYHPSHPLSSYFLQDKEQARGIHCRFGMPGIVAEAHYDGHLNMAGLFGGVRRWILAHPNQCQNLYLHPREHPSGRHSELNWAEIKTIDHEKYPNFGKAQVNEILVTGGMVLYLPTNWFHYIVSLSVNYQCNIRSGKTKTYDQEIRDCGF
jgi:hypothetical protein